MPDDGSELLTHDAALIIREATRRDLDGLARLEEAAFASDRLSRRSFAALIGRSSSTVLVAAIGERLAGYALLLFRAGSRVGRLYSIAVRPEATGRGFASRLLASAETVARSRGMEALSLEVRIDNAAAIAMYQQSGFELHGRRDGYYEDGAAALLYKRSLRPDEPASLPRPLGQAA